MAKPLRFLSPLHKATRQIGVWFEEQMSDTGLMPQEGHLLTYLRSYAPCPVSDIVTVFNLRGSTATSVLDRLESGGLITRRMNPDDRRSFLLELTAKGEEMAERVQIFVNRFESAMARRVSEQEEKGFQAVIAAVATVTNVTLVKRDAVSPSQTRSAPRIRSRTR
jgi:MarR family transcriptional regulator, organic hydroperoxide resistance regulator